jgi:hypothetical protein
MGATPMGVIIARVFMDAYEIALPNGEQVWVGHGAPTSIAESMAKVYFTANDGNIRSAELPAPP